MRSWATAAALLTACGAQAISYDLPIDVSCGDGTISGVGAIICPSLPEGVIRLKVKVPPTKGQMRILDCEQELTADGNPDDFNMQIEKKGWWLWRKTVRILDKTPEVWLPNKDYTDCPIIVSVTGEGAGVHTAAIVYEPRKRHDFVNLECSGGEVHRNQGTGTCRTFEGARIRFSLTPDAEMAGKSHLFVVGTGCGINEKRSLENFTPIEIDMPRGLCIVDVGMVVDGARFIREAGVSFTVPEWPPVRTLTDKDLKLKSRFLLIGEDRSARKLDNPVMVREKDSVRVYKPQGATMVATEIYLKERVLWRSGVRKDESYVLRPSEDNGEQYRSSGKWPSGTVACHTAYTDKFNSMSTSCYDLNTLREMPYFFR